MSNTSDLKLLKESFCDFFTKILPYIKDEDDSIKSKWQEFRDYLLNQEHQPIDIFLYVQQIRFKPKLRFESLNSNTSSPLDSPLTTSKQQSAPKPSLYARSFKSQQQIQGQEKPQKIATEPSELKTLATTKKIGDHVQPKFDSTNTPRMFNYKNDGNYHRSFHKKTNDFPGNNLLTAIKEASSQISKNNQMLFTVFTKTRNTDQSAFIEDDKQMQTRCSIYISPEEKNEAFVKKGLNEALRVYQNKISKARGIKSHQHDDKLILT